MAALQPFPCWVSEDQPSRKIRTLTSSFKERCFPNRRLKGGTSSGSSLNYGTSPAFAKAPARRAEDVPPSAAPCFQSASVTPQSLASDSYHSTLAPCGF